LLPLLEQLTGLAETKPFECVGTLDEVRSALVLAARRAGSDHTPALVAHMLARHAALMPGEGAALSLLQSWNAEHAVPAELVAILRQEVAQLAK
jgi:UDP-N-acetyl-alpha-D-muramoyl-L-alanyl-L-glutamate epimerase